jgi:hypothetical protein
MFDQFWQQYPQGSILSDLVQIHEDLYVVKVTLTSAGHPLVSALGAADRIEAAETTARDKAMQILGCTGAVETLPPEAIASSEVPDITTDVTTTNTISTGTKETTPTPAPVVQEELPSTTYQEPIETPLPIEESIPAASSLESSPASLASNGSSSMPFAAVAPAIAEPETLPVTQDEEPATTTNKTRSKKATTAVKESAPVESTPETNAPEDTAPLSVTDIIPLINMELKRLNWSREQGRDYMVSLYNKRASSLLSDEELFGLLQHLRAESTTG